MFHGPRLSEVAATCACFLLGAQRTHGEQVREKVIVDAVQIRVAAFDTAGKPVQDLKPTDLTLWVDGQIVPVDGLAIDAPLTPPRTPPLSIGAPAGPLADERDLRVTAALMIVVDDVSSGTVTGRRDALTELAKYIETDMHASRILIATYRGGAIHLDLPWTTDRGRASETLRRLRDHPTVAGMGSGLTNRTGALEFQMFRARLQTALMQALAMFPEGPMTRQLLIVTGGRALAPFLSVAGAPDADGRHVTGPSLAPAGQTSPDPGAMDTPAEPLGNGFELWSLALGGAMAQGDNRPLEAKAMERDVALVPITTARTEAVSYGDVRSKGRPQTSGLSAQLATNQVLWDLARETGGGSLILAGKAASELAKRSGQGAYLLSFRYGPGEAGRFHRVELTSNRPGVSLEYRRGFRIRTPEERLLDTVFAQLLLADGSLNDLALSASLTPAGAAGDHTQLTLRYSPPGEPAGGPPRSVELVAVGRDAEGTWTQPVRWSGEATATGDGAWEVKLELAIGPGSRTWSVGLRDTSSSLDGYAVARAPAP